MKPSSLPPSLQRRDDLQAVRDDILPYIGTSIEERAQILSSLCRLAAAQVEAHPNGARILEYEDRRSAESEQLWLHLVASAR